MAGRDFFVEAKYDGARAFASCRLLLHVFGMYMGGFAGMLMPVRMQMPFAPVPKLWQGSACLADIVILPGSCRISRTFGCSVRA